MPLLTSLEPIRVVEGARLWLRGEGFPLPDSTSDIVTIGGVPARLSFAGTDRVAVLVPAGLRGGEAPVKVTWVPGATLFARIGGLIATGLHQVDNPVFGPDGSLYVTYSGVRGQESAVSVFRVGASGAREPFVRGMVNPTSMAFGPDRRLYISSRFDGRVYRVFEDGRYEVFASDLGLACGLVFGRDGTISSAIDRAPFSESTRTAASRRSRRFRRAWRRSTWRWDPMDRCTSRPRRSRPAIRSTASTPTRASRRSTTLFGRPQGLAFDPSGVLHVVEALAGSSGVYALGPGARRELIVAGNNLVGVAFDPAGHIVVAANDSVYSFAPSLS